MSAVKDLYRARLALAGDMQAHLPTLYWLVRLLKVKQGLELGVRSGFSTSALLAGLEETGGRLTSFDWNGQQGLPGLDIDPALSACEHWTLIEGDSVALEPQAPKRLDLLFIDSMHDYETTRAELDAYGERTRKVIALHDMEAYGVAKAVEEWLKKHPRDWLIEDERDHGFAAIMRRP